jgi:hypothetical protein
LKHIVDRYWQPAKNSELNTLDKENFNSLNNSAATEEHPLNDQDKQFLKDNIFGALDSVTRLSGET